MSDRAAVTGAYDRGHVAGEIAARLTNHDKHFEMINGSLTDIAKRLGEFRLSLQKQNDLREADQAMAVALATALKEMSDKSWSPWAKAFTVLGIVSLLVTTIMTITQAT